MLLHGKGFWTDVFVLLECMYVFIKEELFKTFFFKRSLCLQNGLRIWFMKLLQEANPS